MLSTEKYWSVLQWPIISWVVVDVVFLIVAFNDDVLGMLNESTIGPLTLAFGVWAGYKAIEHGGNYGDAVVVGLVVGLVCGLLTWIGFGIVHVDFADIWPLAVFAFSFNVAGALVGGGFALTKSEPARML